MYMYGHAIVTLVFECGAIWGKYKTARKWKEYNKSGIKYNKWETSFENVNYKYILL